MKSFFDFNFKEEMCTLKALVKFTRNSVYLTVNSDINKQRYGCNLKRNRKSSYRFIISLCAGGYAQLVQTNIQMIPANGLTDLLSLNLSLSCRSECHFCFLTPNVPFAATGSPELNIYTKLCTREQLHKGYVPGSYSVIMQTN